MMAAMTRPATTVLRVPCGTFSADDPWALPTTALPVSFRCATDGAGPRLATTLAAFHDGMALYLLFSGDDDGVVANYLSHDDPLYKEDVVEAFLAPERVTEYFELEVSPLGTTFDARIVSPEGVRRSMRTDLEWTCEDFLVFIRRDTGPAVTRVDTLLQIPFASLRRGTPRAGESWRANFFRIDRSPLGDEYSAWQPTMRSPADFHVTAAFGTLLFD